MERRETEASIRRVQGTRAAIEEKSGDVGVSTKGSEMERRLVEVDSSRPTIESRDREGLTGE